MNPTDKIDQLIKELKTAASPDLDRRIDTLIAQPLQSRPRPLNTWSIIMKSKTIKLSIAAMVFLAVLLSINPFGDKVPLTPIAFAEVIKAMEEAAWLHQVSSGLGGSGTNESWLGMKDKIFAGKSDNGAVMFWEIGKGERQVYYPETKEITVSRTSEDEFPLSFSSPAAMFQSMHDMLIKAGAQAVMKSAEYNGRKVQLQEYSVTVGEQFQKLSLYVEPETKRLIAAQITAKDAAGNIIMDGEATFSYLETGPQSIYDLGVPKDTPIENADEPVSGPGPAIGRIDAAESWPDPEDLVRRYWQARHEKDFETTRLYWPGSEAWDEETFRKESPVEYVFGPSKQINDITLCIPYDVKSDYEQNHTYRWKMILSSAQSQKGRYYILSGN